jgi:hypothetical protein
VEEKRKKKKNKRRNGNLKMRHGCIGIGKACDNTYKHAGNLESV